MQVHLGLQKYPTHPDLLGIASNVYWSLGDNYNSLKYAKLLIRFHPDRWDGYELAIREMITLHKLEDAILIKAAVAR